MSKFYFQVVWPDPEKRRYQIFETAHGPFDTDRELLDHIQKQHHDKGTLFIRFDGSLLVLPTNPRELPEDQKRAPGDEKNWELDDNREWVCRTCKGNILVAKVAHPVHVAGLNGGFGECRYEEIGYCPNCEKKPDFHGTPIQT